jgi:hypothetical protein
MVVSTNVTVWHGTFSELCELRTAVERNCNCAWAAEVCQAHRLLLEQRTLDRLLFVFRTVAYYIAHEQSA